MKVLNVHLWNEFRKLTMRRRPAWSEACDCMRRIEGEPTQLRGKILPFVRRPKP